MEFNFETQDGTNVLVEIEKPGFDESWASLISSETRGFEYELDIDEDYYGGAGVRGDDALWIPYSEEYGMKIIAENSRYQSLQDSLEVVKRIQEAALPAFPTIRLAEIVTDQETKQNFLMIDMQNMGEPNRLIRGLTFVPPQHRMEVARILSTDAVLAVQAIDDMFKLDVCPEDEWYKSINFINGKIVDFHRFTTKPERYKMPSNGHSQEDISQIYSNMVDRYKVVLDNHGMPKWKGKIYQGFMFDNGAEMKGYQSDNVMPDSYKKLPFVPLNKCTGKKVLDLGSNQGFFSFQAALHGASEVTGVELTKQDVEAAEDIKRITGLDNVNFVNGDLVQYVMESNEHYGLVIFNSVLHQIYPNFAGSEHFLQKLSTMTDYLAFETPLNHPLMNISPATVKSNLEIFFPIVRLLHVYDSYSSGYRANYVCYSNNV